LVIIGSEKENFVCKLINLENSNIVVDATVKVDESSKYNFNYTCPVSGKYKIDISLNGESAFKDQQKTIVVKDTG
jgi:hypothetical protein